MISWWHTEIEDEERGNIAQALADCRFTHGEWSNKLEAGLCEALDAPYAVVTNSGTSALVMTLLGLGIKPGDEVIVPAVTWIATAQAVALLGAKAILADTIAEAPIIDPEDVARKANSRTKAIIPVHLNGRYCDLERLREIAQEHDAYLVEDTCKGMMSKTPEGTLGTLSDAGCFSMGMISLVSVGYGGFVLPKTKELYDRLRIIRDHGVVREPVEEYRYLAHNFKISDLLTSMGVAQLPKLGSKIAAVAKIHDIYSEGLKNLDYLAVLPIDKAGGKVPLYTELMSPHREQIAGYLQENGVQVSRYHLPLHHAAYLEPEGEFPNAEKFTSQCFMVPSGPAQPMKNIEKVIELLRAWKPE